jgi:hypothetical protein
MSNTSGFRPTCYQGVCLFVGALRTQPGTLTLQPELEARLSGDQKRLLALNRALVYLLSGRLPPARDIAAALARDAEGAAAGVGGSHTAPHLVPLLQAAVLLQDGKVCLVCTAWICGYCSTWYLQ